VLVWADAADKGLNLRRRRANVLQNALAQQIGIALAGFRKLDDLVRYRLLDVVVAGADLQGNADLLEGDTQDTHRFLIKSVAV
jgi:hypothetical protein